jgi:hypothetical protein
MGLVNPRQLEGMDGNNFVEGLSVDQHRYYWPMRDLIGEEVIFNNRDLRRLGCDDDDSERETKWCERRLTPPSPKSSYVTMRVAGTLLQRELQGSR